MGRTVTLALLAPDGTPLGTTPEFEVESQWWQEVAPVVAGARTEFGIEVTVLRLVAAERAQPHGGAVTYLAECHGPSPEPWRLALVPAADAAQLGLVTRVVEAGRSDEGARALRGVELGTFDEKWVEPHPLRMKWAEPGGPAEALRWAGVEGGAQQRTWNLSSVWRLDGTWLKEVPPFLRQEPIVLEWLGKRAPGTVPRLLEADGGRMLLAEVPGTDRYDAGVAEIVAMVRDLFEIQAMAAEHVDELLARGVPDWRAESFIERAAAVAGKYADQLTTDERDRLGKLVAGLPERFARLADCGIPDSLVHGDFHPGNVRSDGSSRVILDWTDSVIGHPALDVRNRPELVQEWSRLWRKKIAGSEPERALELTRPLGSLRGAAVYDAFLQGIEPSERPYHAADPLNCLREAANYR